MDLLLKRDPNPGYTVGKLYIGKEFECFTLEDQVRKVKIKGETAIPAGKYKVDITWSPRFKRLMPILLEVPNFEGIRIHTGNDVDDTEGCILTGQMVNKNRNQLFNSRLAYEALFKKLQKALNDKEEVWITIIN